MHPETSWPNSGLRDLPGPPAVRIGARGQDVQAEVWASRVKPPGEESADRAGGDYRAESRFLRRPGVPAVQRRGDDAPESERPHQRRAAPQVAAAVQRAVPSGSLAWSARFALFVHAVHGLDEGIRAAGEFAP